MRKSVSRIGVITAVTVMSMWAADNSLGTWKRNIEKSTSNRPSKNPYKQLTTVREGIEGGVRVTIKAVRMDGSREEMGYSLKYDGTPVELKGAGAFDWLAVKQVDANTLLIENKKIGGKYHTTSKSVVSPDGKTMTNTVTGVDNEGRPVAMTIVYDKQ